jgi:O-methyltransferase involved in polyketide biosynthesis
MLWRRPSTAETSRVAARNRTPGGVPTFHVWEGVTQYLREAGVRATFDFLRGAAPGSQRVFTYVRRDFIAGTELYGLEGLHRRLVGEQHLWHFGWIPQEIGEFLGAYGWRTVEHLGTDELTARYVTPTGRAMTVMPIERLVLAEKI